MTNLIEFAGITGTLAASVLISILVGRLALEAFFRIITPNQRVTVSPAQANPSQIRVMK